jgi:asparagine synthase (glutamine-hydrolysing)
VSAPSARHIGAQHTHVVVEPQQLSDPVVRRRMLSAQQDLPYPVAEALATMYLLCRSVRRYTSVAITGEWADDVFGSYLGMDDPDVIGSGTLPWVAFAQKFACPTGLGTGLFDT